MTAKDKLFTALLGLFGLGCLWPQISPALALAAGAVLALALGNPFGEKISKASRLLLALSVVGIGAGMDLHDVLKAGASGLGYTLAGIVFALGLGALLGRALKADRDTSLLVSVGTAICGGSAIAAIAPVIRAKPHAISVALATVFLLNGVALVVFPPVGHFFGLSQEQFGLWAALAVHDTSSVVGATLHYGQEALQTGTTVKLARALWIVPLAFFIGYAYARKGEDAGGGKVKKPWFILGFIALAALVTWFPALQGAGEIVAAVAKRLMVLTLFLIGTNLTMDALKSVGPRPLVLGVVLWLCVAGLTLWAVMVEIVR